MAAKLYSLAACGALLHLLDSRREEINMFRSDALLRHRAHIRAGSGEDLEEAVHGSHNSVVHCASPSHVHERPDI